MIKIVFTLLLFVSSVAMADEPPTVTIAEPYIEMRTGPGRGFPIFHVAAQGDDIKILKQRTSWFLIETLDRRPKKGWARLGDMTQTAASYDQNEPIYASFPSYERDARSWQWSASGGDFAGAASIAASLSYRLTRNIEVQLEGTQILGDFSDGAMVTGSVLHHPFPDWRFSPYFQIGAGVLNTQPSATLVQAEDRTDNTLIVGGGMSFRLNQRFNFIMDYRRHTVLTSRDQNEEIDQWKLGINVSL